MPGRDRFKYAALGLVAGVGLALLFFVWTVPEFRDPSRYQVGQQSAQQKQSGHNEPVEPAGFWRTYTTPQDTYAQWIMAAFTIAATGVSLYAVKLVRATLRANTEANQIARDANEAQIRAYLVVEEASAEFVRNTKGGVTAVEFRLVVRNGGATPAINIGHIFNITEPIVGPSPKSIKPGSRSVVTINTQAHRERDLSPGDNLTIYSEAITIVAFNSYNANKGKLNCSMDCQIQYRPVASTNDKFLIVRYWIRSDQRGKDIRISRSGENTST